MIETLQIGNASDDKLQVTLSGKAEAIIRVLAQGLPLEDLQQVADALKAELERRATMKS